MATTSESIIGDTTADRIETDTGPAQGSPAAPVAADQATTTLATTTVGTITARVSQLKQISSAWYSFETVIGAQPKSVGTKKEHSSDFFCYYLLQGNQYLNK